MNTRGFAIVFLTLMIASAIPVASSVTDTPAQYLLSFPLDSRINITPKMVSSPYDDEFNGPSLNARWSWYGEDSDRWSLTASPGNLRLVGTNADMWKSCNNPKNLLLQQAPTGDFEVQTKLVIAPTVNYQQGGLLVFQDLDNYLKLDVVWNTTTQGGLSVEYIFEQGGVPINEPNWPWISIHPSRVYFLKLAKSGDVYSGYFSLDGELWTQVGSWTTSVFISPKIGLFSLANNCSGNTPDISVDFDFFRVNTASGRITSPSDNITIGPLTLIFAAEAWSTGSSNVDRVEFYVHYDGVWHNAGVDNSYPYEIIWQTPNKLRSQQLKFGIYVVDNDNNIATFAGGVHRVNFVESLGVPGIDENWIPTRAYLNQRSLEPNGDLKCSAASMSMLLAMNGIIAVDYSALESKANEMYPNVLINGTAYVYKMAAELNRQGAVAEYFSEPNGVTQDEGWRTIKREIDAGRPVIVRTTQGVLTSHGHFFVAVGYREATESREVIAYDPFGKWKGTCCTNNYDTNSRDAQSRKGQWVYYDFGQAFGSSNWLITARPASPINNLQESTATPSTPPDSTSNEPETIGTYEGANNGIGSQLFLPLLMR
jgi:hypothetical protein